MREDDPPDKEPTAANCVWEQLNDSTRALVLELFAQLGYQHAVALHEKSVKRREDVPTGRDTEGPAGAR